MEQGVALLLILCLQAFHTDAGVTRTRKRRWCHAIAECFFSPKPCAHLLLQAGMFDCYTGDIFPLSLSLQQCVQLATVELWWLWWGWPALEFCTDTAKTFMLFKRRVSASTWPTIWTTSGGKLTWTGKKSPRAKSASLIWSYFPFQCVKCLKANL